MQGANSFQISLCDELYVCKTPPPTCRQIKIQFSNKQPKITLEEYTVNGKISNPAQIASLRQYTYTSGREAGISVIDCDNGKLRFLLNVTKALDVMQLFSDGRNVSFLSKNAFTAREIPFLSRFEGGMLYTCGLDSVGGREGFELHGSLHNNAAEVVRAECNEDGIVVEAIVRDTSLFGQNLTLKRRVTSAIGSDTVSVEDTLVNNGTKDEDYCLLYHVNVGYPMLDEGAEVVAEILRAEPRTEWSRQTAADMLNISASVDNQEESCYFLTLGSPEASLVNKKLGKKFTVRYSADTLPHFVEWRSMASGDYALGLEPCTTELDDRFKYKKIAAGERVKFALSFTVEDLK